MTPATIIERAADDGVIITLTPAGTVKTTGSRDAVARWVPTLRANRGAIVAALTKASNDPPAVSPADASPVWLIHCPDRQPVEVHFWPPATLAEALTGYPTAINGSRCRPRMAQNRSRTRRSPTKRRKPRLRPMLAAGGLALLLCRRDPAGPAGT